MNQREASQLPTTKKNSNNIIVFWDFKNYWKDALEHISEKFDKKSSCKIEIKEWEVDYSSYSDVINGEGNLIGSNYNSNALHVFIAPITWAGLYTNHFKILGPAFGTYGDIKLYNLKDKANGMNSNGKKKTKDKITIGVIDELATSTIGLQIILKGICKQVGNGTKLNNLNCESYWDSRLTKLKNREFTAVVFNEDDVSALTHHKHYSSVNDIVDIDELYALAKRISNLPRVVYAISNNQFNDTNLIIQKNALINVLNSIKDNLPNAINGKKHILAPFNDDTRKSIVEFIKDGENAFGNTNGSNKITLNKNDHKKIELNFYKHQTTITK